MSLLRLFPLTVMALGLVPGLGYGAQLTLCATDLGVRVAHGQQMDRGWVTEGWTRIDAGECQVLAISIDKPIDLRFLALALDGSGPILTSRLRRVDTGQEPHYMRDEQLVCMADGDFESVGTVISPFQECPDGQDKMVLPTRIIVPANNRYRLSF